MARRRHTRGPWFWRGAIGAMLLGGVDAAAMRVAERAVMDALGYEPDDAPHHM